MSDLTVFGRMLILIGVICLLIGGLFMGLGKAPGLGWLGRLPGDILIQRKNFTFYFPFSTGLLLSLLLSALLWLISRN